MKIAFSKKSGQSSYSVLILICTLIGSALAARLVTTMQEKAVEKRRLRKEFSETTEPLKQENYDITYVVTPNKPSNSPTSPSSGSSVTNALRAPNFTPKTFVPTNKSAGEAAEITKPPGYIAATMRTNVSKMTIRPKNSKPVDGKRIAFP
ncbi:MAG: hypothetical protein JWN25_1421 [Verrucomicrobiales bacterium]|jgi:hypothetical protein|nr:hypothetical protein [Verrucomicrobiales bacterium]MDB6130987.1 hypothetical protein [Verrucomicrobiales bacterium]